MIVTINTDASFSKLYRRGTYAFWIVSNAGRIRKSGLLRKECALPQIAEFKCIINAVHTLAKADLPGVKRIIINTDCMDVIHLIEKDQAKIKRYGLMNWGCGLVVRFEKTIKDGNLKGIPIDCRHVKSHVSTSTSRQWVNDWCDREAKRHMNIYLQTQLIQKRKMKKTDHDLKFLLATANGDASSLRSAGFTASEVRSAGFTASEVRSAGFTASEVLSAGFTASEVRSAGFTASEVRSAGFTDSEVLSAGFTASSLRSAGFTASEVLSAGFTASSLLSAGFTASEVLSAGFTASEVLSAGFKEKDLEEWNSIPVLDKPYSKLLADIKNKKRIHQQSTFGPEYDPGEENVCGTPMCTAGHLVNMAGKIGYDLRQKYGWATAAALIHFKTHPGQPIQNFSSIPQDWAMAYIEEMAKRENEPKKENH